MITKNPYRAAGTFRGVSYVERRADRLLRAAIEDNSRFPYILAPRQSGKSSLLANVVTKLDPALYLIAFVDLSTFGPACLASREAFLKAFFEQCYECVGVQKELDPVKWRPNIERMLDATLKRILIVLDEVDWLSTARFKDSFFSSIRSTFNERAWVDEFVRAQFVLAGAAHPSELVNDPSISPFNVSSAAVELDNLTREQVLEMSSHLETCGASISVGVPQSIFDYAHGSVYLTQLILENLWTEGRIERVSSLQCGHVDRIVDRIVGEAPGNVHFRSIRDSIAREPGLAKALGDALEGRAIRKEAAEALSIIGILRADGRFANEIYRRVFDDGQPLSVAPPGAERRQLTVMFSEFTASSVLAERLDPEDFRQVLYSYQAITARVIGDLGGHVAQYLGDGVLAYFSYPEAHEDDAERAVRAGLRIVSELRGSNRRLEDDYGLRVGVRIAIHTGWVVVGSVGGGVTPVTLALGETVNVAARLQSVGEHDSVVISDETLRLVRGLFVTELLGVHTLRGITAPVTAHRVVQSSGVQSRLEAAAAADLTPLVGREHELAFLLERWNEARRGRGRVVFLGGDAGIGKSRLVQEFRGRLSEEGHTWLQCRGSPFETNSRLQPIIGLVREALNVRRKETSENQVAALKRAVAEFHLPQDSVPLLAELLSLPASELHPPPRLDLEAQWSRAIELLERWLFAQARRQPTVLAVDDMQWVDRETREYLDRLVNRIADSRLLLLMIGRLDSEMCWPEERVDRLILTPLSRGLARKIVAAISGEHHLSDSVAGAIIDRANGVPLFVEELTKALIEAGAGHDRAHVERSRSARSGQELAIPSTLQESLMARIDRLSLDAKKLVKLGATLGREFSYHLIDAVAETDSNRLERNLSELIEAGFIQERSAPPRSLYIFTHALVQEVAYESQLKSVRRASHVRVVEILKERFPERVAAEPEMIARHCELGDLKTEAVLYYERAGKLARDRLANAEAVEYLSRALDILGSEPQSDQRDRLEMNLRAALNAIELDGNDTP